MGLAGIAYFALFVVFIGQIEHDGAGFEDRCSWRSRAILDGGDPAIGIDFQEPFFLNLVK